MQLSGIFQIKRLKHKQEPACNTGRETRDGHLAKAGVPHSDIGGVHSFPLVFLILQNAIVPPKIVF